MRQHSLLTLCVSLLLLMGAVSCTGTNKRSDSASTAQAVALPELAEGQLVEFEDDTLRIVDATPEGTDQAVFLIQPKWAGFAPFEVKGAWAFLAFEAKTTGHLLLSEGTGVIRELQAFDLLTGKMTGKFEQYMSGPTIEVENDNQILFYAYGNDYPQAQWDPAAGEWTFSNDVPEHLKASVRALDSELQDFVFTAMAYRKIRMYLDSGRIEELDEYKWGYMQ